MEVLNMSDFNNWSHVDMKGVHNSYLLMITCVFNFLKAYKKWLCLNKWPN